MRKFFALKFLRITRYQYNIIIIITCNWNLQRTALETEFSIYPFILFYFSFNPELAEQPKNGILLDEAYEMFHSSGGVSGIKYVKDLDNR